MTKQNQTQLSRFTTLMAAAFVSSLASFEAAAQSCPGPKPTICDRTCWNARSPQCSISQMSTLNRAVIHHTASSGDYNTGGLTDTKGRVRGVQNYHMDVNGWCDIGYHFLFDKHGNILSGRPGSAAAGDYPRGAHDGCNDNSFGFTALGYYHPPYNNTPTDAMINAMEKAIAWKLPSGWVPTGNGSTYCSGVQDKVISHRAVSATACPGDKMHNKTTEGSGFEDAIAARRSCN